MRQCGVETEETIFPICYRFTDNGEPMKTSVENGPWELYKLSTDIIKVGNQMIFNLSGPQLHTLKGREIPDTLDQSTAHKSQKCNVA